MQPFFASFFVKVRMQHKSRFQFFYVLHFDKLVYIMKLDPKSIFGSLSNMSSDGMADCFRNTFSGGEAILLLREKNLLKTGGVRKYS